MMSNSVLLGQFIRSLIFAVVMVASLILVTDVLGMPLLIAMVILIMIALPLAHWAAWGSRAFGRNRLR